MAEEEEYTADHAYFDLLMVRRTFTMTNFDTGPGEALDRLYKAAVGREARIAEIDRVYGGN